MPEKAQRVLAPASRFKVLYGGRGSGKSYAYANKAIVDALYSKLRFLCCREYQSSIRDSVYRLLCDRIYSLHLESYFDIQRDIIYGKSGSEFIFKGLHQNISEIKSMEGIDRVWFEEAEKGSRESLDVLLPTIRKPGSQIWFSFNPESETSPIYTDFVLHPPSDCLVAKLNYYDNELFPEVLIKQREWCRINDPEKFQYVWEGFPKKYGQAVIFKNKIRIEEFEDPDTDTTQLYFGADFGFGVDPTCLVCCFIQDKKLYIWKEFYGYGIEIDDLPACWEKMPKIHQYRVIADSARPDTISHMCNHGFDCVGAEKGKGSVEDGIEFLKSFEAIVIHPGCKGSIGDFENYRWKVDKTTEEVLPIPVDKSNHSCDACRYALEPYIKNSLSCWDVIPEENMFT